LRRPPLVIETEIDGGFEAGKMRKEMRNETGKK